MTTIEKLPIWTEKIENRPKIGWNKMAPCCSYRAVRVVKNRPLKIEIKKKGTMKLMQCCNKNFYHVENAASQFNSHMYSVRKEVKRF